MGNACCIAKSVRPQRVKLRNRCSEEETNAFNYLNRSGFVYYHNFNNAVYNADISFLQNGLRRTDLRKMDHNFLNSIMSHIFQEGMYKTRRDFQKKMNNASSIPSGATIIHCMR